MLRAVQYYGDQPALSLGNRRSTFRELHGQVRSLVGTLCAAGFKSGDRLALLLPNGPAYIQLVYACSWLGVIVVPINTRPSTIEIDHVLSDAAPHGLVRHSSLPVPGVRVPWEVVFDQEQPQSRGESCPHPCYDPEAILALIYTSGTTGHPKGVVLTHSNIWSTVLVPTMINLLAQSAEIEKHDLSSLQVLAYGGSPMMPDLIRRTRDVLPRIKLVQVYGLSETGYLTGLQDGEHTEERLTSCGRSCPGIEVRVADESGRLLETGQRGEIVARGANVTGGYWNNPEETSSAFRNGFFRTGDIGYQDATGYFYILDRLNDMIVTGGENVYCGEVEGVIHDHPAVREAAVFGIPDAQWGELVAACVVLKPGADLAEETLLAHCRRSLANYKIPRQMKFSDTDLPKSGSGKVLKRLLREGYWAGTERPI
jgi:acyl-CoA synthetase (AMP-forming)/AMP-acid ligase II